ncbi:MAG: cell division topological specificity factor MinE [Christensenellales bacterium]|jgi:septum formation topological specificity factor MinE
MKEKDKSIERLKKLLTANKSFIPSGIYSAIRYDLLKVLKSYFQIHKEDIDIKIEVDQDGKYSIDIKVIAEKACRVNTIEDKVKSV